MYGFGQYTFHDKLNMYKPRICILDPSDIFTKGFVWARQT